MDVDVRVCVCVCNGASQFINGSSLQFNGKTCIFYVSTAIEFHLIWVRYVSMQIKIYREKMHWKRNYCVYIAVATQANLAPGVDVWVPALAVGRIL